MVCAQRLKPRNALKGDLQTPIPQLFSSSTMARRLYLGRTGSLFCFNLDDILILPSLPTGLPQDARSEDVAKFFDGYGRIVDVRVMTGGFSL
jgi:hypothetical protein